MADSWGGAWASTWSDTWGGAAASAALPDVGVGRVYYQGGKKRRHKKRLAENVREWIDEAYAEMTAPEAPREIRVAAAQIVKPVAQSKAPIPAASQVDWGALAAEGQMVKELLALYERVETEKRRLQAEIEDEDAVLMGMFL